MANHPCFNQSVEQLVIRAVQGVAGWLIIIGTFALIPKVSILLGAIVGGAGLVVFAVWAIDEHTKTRAVRQEQDRIGQATQAAVIEERARKAEQQRIETLGAGNAASVDSALSAIRQIGASEAARTGWLGDVDFAADVQVITDNFQRADALRKVVNTLSNLNKPSDDDRVILAEAKTAIANLERTASERVDLIVKCATEARLIDKTLSDERKEAKTAERRAELHAKLSGMLYAIEATPNATPTDSAVDAVMIRVNAFREIKNQMTQLARDD